MCIRDSFRGVRRGALGARLFRQRWRFAGNSRRRQPRQSDCAVRARAARTHAHRLRRAPRREARGGRATAHGQQPP
eukprot:13387056-Alexandrium_andersonii.AAC.1